MRRRQKITFSEMRQMGVRGVLIYCSDYHCSHSTLVDADRWPDQVAVVRYRAAIRLQGLREQGRRRPAGLRSDPQEARLMPWSTPFRPPIELPDGRTIATLDDARSFIFDLSEAAQKST
jgi:hypothetical protein